MNEFSEQFKDRIVQMVVVDKRSVKEVAEEQGIDMKSLRAWVVKYQNDKRLVQNWVDNKNATK